MEELEMLLTFVWHGLLGPYETSKCHAWEKYKMSDKKKILPTKTI